ncbi:MAG TPA: hypothetical protein PKA05_02145 [Roseiflexaceae bacterium]|nr:hypothetical protein [Roseiflexaceae bacterium]
MIEQIKTAFEGHVVVEMFGHRRLSGFGRSVPAFGTEFLRLDVALPEGEAPVSLMISAAGIFSVALVSEERAAALATNNASVLAMMQLRDRPPAAAWKYNDESRFYDDE